MWFAAMVVRDRSNFRAKSVLRQSDERVTSDHVVVETWLLLNSRNRRDAAEQFWERIRQGIARIEHVTPSDFESAWAIGEVFRDQDFSIVDRTSFTLMERLGITKAASFDDDFAVYRYGRSRDKAFEVLR